MVGEVIVVFDGLECGGLAEEAKVMDWDGVWEEGLKGWTGDSNVNGDRSRALGLV